MSTEGETKRAQKTGLHEGGVLPNHDELRRAYRLAVRSRCTDQHLVRLVSRGEVSFSIWGSGEEVHGTATALALSKVVGPEKLGLVPHYRSGCLCAMWCALQGRPGFTRDVLRQQFSKDTDGMSRGRQQVYQLDMKEVGILPMQGPVGMQLGKAAGYALGYTLKGIQDAITMGIIGDGTSAKGELHDTMNAVSVWSLPTIICVTDNGVALTTTPEEGRGIKCFDSYAKGFGVRAFACDGNDFWDVYRTTLRCALYVRDEQKPALLHVHSLPRLNGHSSAGDMSFDLSQPDPLVAFGTRLVEMGVLKAGEALRRTSGSGRDFFRHHELGRVMGEENESVERLLSEVRAEPDPPVDSVHTHIRPPFPAVTEAVVSGQTHITYGGAIRAALDHLITRHGGAMWGQDVASLGGVMQASAGLLQRHPGKVLNAPLNEALIVGTACGAALHDDFLALPEIQFGDHSLNTLHWLVHMGNLYWASNGNSRFSMILRMPTDPFGGGGMYHSMSVDGYFTPIPGLVVVMPSTSWDVYGLLLSAAEYRSPVVFLEPKWMYRQTLGPAFPGEPTEAKAISTLKKQIMRGSIPKLDPSLRVPLGKAVIRRPGADVTIVAWGRAVWTAMEAAKSLEPGVDAEVIDLRTLVPPDLETVYASVERTGRLIVVAEDRAFAGFVRTIQGHVVERYPGIPTRALGQKDIPGIAECRRLEDATVLASRDIVQAVRELQPADPVADPLSGATRVERVAATPLPQDPLAGPTATDPAAGLPSRLGNYRVLGLIGAGGMGTVVRARHDSDGWARRQGGDVALKLIHPHIASDPAFQERFFDEAELGKRVQHPGLARVYDVVTEGPWMGIPLELVEGRELSEWVHKGGRPVHEVVALLKPLAEALDHLHAQGIVHRDLKPANVKVRQDGRPVLLDLGIAKDLSGRAGGQTRTMMALGTSAWMAPEQADAKSVTAAADVYALGLIAYALLSGRMPWDDGDSELRVLTNKMMGRLKPLSAVAVQLPEVVSDTVMGALSVAPEKRPASCGALVESLDATRRAQVEYESLQAAADALVADAAGAGLTLRVPDRLSAGWVRKASEVVAARIAARKQT